MGKDLFFTFCFKKHPLSPVIQGVVVQHHLPLVCGIAPQVSLKLSGAGPSKQGEGPAIIGAHDQIYTDGLPALSFLLAALLAVHSPVVQLQNQEAFLEMVESIHLPAGLLELFKG